VYGPSLVLTVDSAQPSRPRDGDHHDAARGVFAPEVVEWQPDRVPEDDLLEADAGTESQRARTETADRARRDVDDADVTAVDAELGVDGSLTELERARRALRALL